PTSTVPAIARLPIIGGWMLEVECWMCFNAAPRRRPALRPRMTKILTILILALVVEAVGVVYLSKGLKQIGEPPSLSVREIGRIIAKGATNGSILFGIALEADRKSVV